MHATFFSLLVLCRNYQYKEGAMYVSSNSSRAEGAGCVDRSC
jgi:hypothetical protein